MTAIVFFGIGANGGRQETGSDAGSALMHHIVDSREWQPVPVLKPVPLHDIRIGPVSIPVTRHLLMLWITAVLMVVVFVVSFHRAGIIPSGAGSALEPVLLFIRDGMVYPTMGESLGDRWLPFLYTLFFFILSSNLLGMIPMFGSATGNLSVTSALAAMVFLCVIGAGMRKNGFIGFFANMIPAGLPLPVGIFLLLIEIPGLVIRNGVLAIRLFANIIAGHFVIYSLLLLIFLVHPLASAVSVPMALFINLLEVLVAIIQAVVFTMLSAIFISMAVSKH